MSELEPLVVEFGPERCVCCGCLMSRQGTCPGPRERVSLDQLLGRDLVAKLLNPDGSCKCHNPPLPTVRVIGLVVS